MCDRCKKKIFPESVLVIFPNSRCQRISFIFKMLSACWLQPSHIHPWRKRRKKHQHASLSPSLLPSPEQTSDRKWTYRLTFKHHIRRHPPSPAHSLTHTHTKAYRLTFTHTYMHACTFLHTHTHTHTHTLSLSLPHTHSHSH